MFYLTVFISGLLLSGLFNIKQNSLSISQNKNVTIIPTNSDSASFTSGVQISTEPIPGHEDLNKSDKRHQFSPFELDFTFHSLLQWFFRLPVKKWG